MARLSQLIERWFPSSGSELIVGSVPVSELASCYDTPLFVYERSVMERKWAFLRDALPDDFSIYYSVKANPSQAVLRCFLEKGAGLEIASAGEFCQAIHTGCPPQKVIFAGPGKTDAELQIVLEKGIREIHVESVREAERISAIAQRRGVSAPVAVRVNPTGEAEGGAMRMGGRPAPFGVDEEVLDDVVGRILALPAIELKGIHLFSGTQILDAGILASQYKKGLEIAQRVSNRLNAPLRTVDFGGGLGIPYFPNEEELDLGKVKECIARLMGRVRDEPCFRGTEFVVEPGRYLVGEAGIYVVRVQDIKVSRGKKFIVTDGGMHQHLAASGNLGQTIKRNYPVAVLNKLGSSAAEQVDVVGPLCTPLDVLARAIQLPPVEIGDILGVFQSGAYARSASPLGFLSHAAPPEVWVEGREHCQIRRRGIVADYSNDQSLPPSFV